MSVTGFSIYISCALIHHLSYRNTQQASLLLILKLFGKKNKMLVSYSNFSDFYVGYASELQVCN